MSKDQRLVFTFRKNPDGTLKIDMSFYPKISKSREEFESLPIYRRELQNAAADCGRFAMQSLADQNQKRLSANFINDAVKETINDQKSQAGTTEDRTSDDTSTVGISAGS